MASCPFEDEIVFVSGKSAKPIVSVSTITSVGTSSIEVAKIVLVDMLGDNLTNAGSISLSKVPNVNRHIYLKLCHPTTFPATITSQGEHKLVEECYYHFSR
ncbi:hypothetical protein GOBAR_AA36518 [Gossypium barbadense]|uniref:Uncharacterized protein n=1 Tax=Gossypium barbadense TaxID=3634 RepID=A0A2P5VZC9_GOSBA|nr:hypothetical protein GOBAR_AA36518 [Gossypium barbadense]